MKDKRIVEAENLLKELKNLKQIFDETASEAENEINTIKEKYSSQLQMINRTIKEQENKLMSLLEKEKDFFFCDSDYKRFDTGVVFYKLVCAVKKTRKINVDLLKKLNFYDAIKVNESVNWDVIEKYTDAELSKLGTCRVSKEVFSYEV